MLILPKKVFRIKGPDGIKTKDPAISADYSSSEQYGRVRLGKLYFYYRDLGVRYYVPYNYIHGAFTRISECPEDEFSNNQQYFRLILTHDGKEFANLIFNAEDTIDKIYGRLAEIAPDIKIGFDGQKK